MTPFALSEGKHMIQHISDAVPGWNRTLQVFDDQKRRWVSIPSNLMG